MMAERGIRLSHMTILRWVQHIPEFEKRWHHYDRGVGPPWRVDETYIKVRGRWVYLYCAFNKQGFTVDFLLSEHRDIAAAKRFFTQAVMYHGPPERITVDGYSATHSAVAELKKEGMLSLELKVRTSKFLNNIIEQDHRRVKQRIYLMLGFKNFAHAAVTISGIELVQKIRKGQFNTAGLTSEAGARVPQLWHRVLAA